MNGKEKVERTCSFALNRVFSILSATLSVLRFCASCSSVSKTCNRRLDIRKERQEKKKRNGDAPISAPAHCLPFPSTLVLPT